MTNPQFSGPIPINGRCGLDAKRQGFSRGSLVFPFFYPSFLAFHPHSPRGAKQGRNGGGIEPQSISLVTLAARPRKVKIGQENRQKQPAHRYSYVPIALEVSYSPKSAGEEAAARGRRENKHSGLSPWKRAAAA